MIDIGFEFKGLTLDTVFEIEETIIGQFGDKVSSGLGFGYRDFQIEAEIEDIDAIKAEVERLLKEHGVNGNDYYVEEYE
jgi:hypothetical protein